jgi:hypothetical protein
MKGKPFKTDQANADWILRRAKELRARYESSLALSKDPADAINNELAFLQQCADLVLEVAALGEDGKPSLPFH